MWYTARMHDMSDDFFDFDTDFEDLLEEFPFQTLSTEQLLLDLEVRKGQLQELEKTVHFLKQLPKSQRREWLDKNKRIAVQLLEQYLNDSLNQFDQVPLDSQTLSQSYEFLTSLRHTVSAVSAVLYETDDLLES